MFYLILMIVAGIMLVAIVLRRLPYLRTHRLGLEINRPTSFMPTSRLSDLWYWLKGKFSASRTRGISTFRHSAPTPLSHNGYNPNPPLSVAPPLSPFRTTGEEENPAIIHPDDFWQDEDIRPSPLEVPTQGLVTRRGESQKIAQELMIQAEEAFRKKDLKEAEKYYLQAATKDPNNARIYNRLGVIYLTTKNYKDAIEAFRGAIKFDDRVASRHYNLALAYLGKRDLRSAERGLKEAISLDPTNDKYRKTLESMQK